MDPVTATPFIKVAIHLVKDVLSAARQKLSKRKYEQLLSATITELLKEHPDLSAAEAQLAAAQATGAEPDMRMLRAQSMLTSVRQFHDRAPGPRFRPAKKKLPMRKPRKKTSKRRAKKPR